MDCYTEKQEGEFSELKNCTDYEEGFGDLNTEFWYGLENIHFLTKNGKWEMRVDYQRNSRTWSYLHYNQFSVGSASEEYPLNIGGFIGEGTDWLAHQPLNGVRFSTPDNDNDMARLYNCAAFFKNGWWYNNCFIINLNRQPPTVASSSIFFTEMKIHPKDCITQ